MNNPVDPHTQQLQDGVHRPAAPGPAAPRVAAYMDAAARLEQALGALAEAMDAIDSVAASMPGSSYVAQLVAERAKWDELTRLTQPEETLAATLASRDAAQHLLRLLAPSLVFPTGTPTQLDPSGEMLHAARQNAELHKENLRKLIAAEMARIDRID